MRSVQVHPAPAPFPAPAPALFPAPPRFRIVGFWLGSWRSRSTARLRLALEGTGRITALAPCPHTSRVRVNAKECCGLRDYPSTRRLSAAFMPTRPRAVYVSVGVSVRKNNPLTS
jgi:hypothetical protein